MDLKRNKTPDGRSAECPDMTKCNTTGAVHTDKCWTVTCYFIIDLWIAEEITVRVSSWKFSHIFKCQRNIHSSLYLYIIVLLHHRLQIFIWKYLKAHTIHDTEEKKIPFKTDHLTNAMKCFDTHRQKWWTCLYLIFSWSYQQRK